MFTAQDVAKLRQITGVGLMECKKALTETNGNQEKAIEYLRERGIATANKKASRIASEGVVQSYIHLGGKIGVLLEVNCETDFVARSEQFLTLVKDVAMHIVAFKPEVIKIEDLPAEKVEAEKAIYRAQALNEGKPATIVERMVEGRLSKYYKEACLLEQQFVKDDSMTVQQVVNEAIQKIGEKITIRRFTRYEMGEGLEKRSCDFASEVLNQIK